MEPERPIEKILRAAASKRRAEPGKTFLLHPVDRKALQAEVASVYASKAESAKTAAPGWRSLWPQIGWTFALVLGLAAAVTMMLPRSGPGPQSFRLAKNEVSRTPAAPSQPLDSNLITLRSASGSLRGERETDRLQAPLAAG